MQDIVQFFKEMSVIKKVSVAIGILLIVVLSLLFLISSNKGSDMVTLYSDLDVKDSGKIVEELDARKIDYTVTGDGSVIRVHQAKVGAVRLALAQAGLPHHGSLIGYEIFDKEDSLGTTNFAQNMKMIRALEGELSRTISAFDQIERARVHLVIPQREVFSKERIEPKASVVLKIRHAKPFGQSEVEAISHLIVTAVPGLEMKNITIVDAHGKALKVGGADETLNFSGKNDELKIAYENRLRNTIEALLESTVGAGKIKAQVALEMNFDKVVTNTETFDPDSTVVRSVHSVDEREQTPVSNSAEQDVSVANNIPGGGSDEGNETKFAIVEKSDQITNYEVSKTIKNHISEIGSIKKMSIGILVDGHYVVDQASGKSEYVQRSNEEIEQITNLVKVAVGFNEERNDKIEVVNMKFAPSDFGSDEPEENWLKEELPNLFQTAIFAIVVLLVLITVIRPIALKAFEVKKNGDIETNMNLSGIDRNGYVTAPVGGEYSDSRVGNAGYGTSDADVGGVSDVENTAMKMKGIAKINNIASDNPQDLVNIFRKWLNEV